MNMPKGQGIKKSRYLHTEKNSKSANQPINNMKDRIYRYINKPRDQEAEATIYYDITTSMYTNV